MTAVSDKGDLVSTFQREKKFETSFQIQIAPTTRRRDGTIGGWWVVAVVVVVVVGVFSLSE